MSRRRRHRCCRYAVYATTVAWARACGRQDYPETATGAIPYTTERNHLVTETCCGRPAPAPLISAAGILFLTATLWAGCETDATAANHRVALVIGNADYVNAYDLASPLNDAREVSAVLERLDFSVSLVENADRVALQDALHDFSESVASADLSVLLFSGHGAMVRGRNYLFPVDAAFDGPQQAGEGEVSLDELMREVEKGCGLRLILLDAAGGRDPFSAEQQGVTRSISLDGGLARVAKCGNTLVSFSAMEGTVILDGPPDGLSPYAAALVRYLEEPGMELGMVLRKVRAAVLEATEGAQEPVTYGSLPGEGVYLSPDD